MVSIIKRIPSFGRKDANRGIEGLPKRIEDCFFEPHSEQRKHSHIDLTPITKTPEVRHLCRKRQNNKYPGFWPENTPIKKIRIRQNGWSVFFFKPHSEHRKHSFLSQIFHL